MIINNKWKLIFSLVGAALGLIYWYFVGCKSGTCMMTSNPLIAIGYAALLGFLAGGIFDQHTKHKEKKQDVITNVEEE